MILIDTKVDKQMKYLGLYIFFLVQVIAYQLIIFYNLLQDVLISMGIAIIIAGVILSLVIRKMENA